MAPSTPPEWATKPPSRKPRRHPRRRLRQSFLAWHRGGQCANHACYRRPWPIAGRRLGSVPDQSRWFAAQGLVQRAGYRVRHRIRCRPVCRCWEPEIAAKSIAWIRTPSARCCWMPRLPRSPASAAAPTGDLYAITGNIGKVFRIGPGFEKKGTFESPVLDAGAFAYWGRISYRGLGKISVFTRSGNRSHPESNWSPWATLANRHQRRGLRFLRRRPHRFTLGSILAIQNRLDARHRPARARGLLRRGRLPSQERRAGGGDHRHHAGQLPLPRASALHHAVHLHHASAHRPAKDQSRSVQ